MPVKQAHDELYDQWRRTSSDYARVVSIHGSGTPAAREAWKRARRALDELTSSRAQIFTRERELHAQVER